MDPWSALSCAAAVLQFVDYSAKLVGSAHEIYVSTSGTLQENIHVEEVAARLQQLSERVEASLAIQHHGSTSQDVGDIGSQEHGNAQQDAAAVVNLARRIHALAVELVQCLGSLKLDRTARFKSWEAFHKALRASFKAEQINALRSRLDGLRSELSLHLTFMIT
jgi:hypothetical protein